MKILGNRVLVSRVEEIKIDGFQSVQVQDSFIYKGKIEVIGEPLDKSLVRAELNISVGDVILFTKYSPDTHEVELNGKKKVVMFDDILSVV